LRSSDGRLRVFLQSGSGTIIQFPEELAGGIAVAAG